MRIEHLVLFDGMGNKVVQHNRNIDFGFSCKKTIIEAPAIINAAALDCEFVGAYTFINYNATTRSVSSIGRFCSIGPNAVIGIANHPAYTLSSSNYS